MLENGTVKNSGVSRLHYTLQYLGQKKGLDVHNVQQHVNHTRGRSHRTQEEQNTTEARGMMVVDWVFMERFITKRLVSHSIDTSGHWKHSRALDLINIHLFSVLRLSHLLGFSLTLQGSKERAINKSRVHRSSNSGDKVQDSGVQGFPRKQPGSKLSVTHYPIPISYFETIIPCHSEVHLPATFHGTLSWLCLRLANRCFQ